MDWVSEYIGKKDWEIQENGNIGYSHQGLIAYLSGKQIKDYWLKKVYPRRVSNAVKRGAIHVHDMNFLGCYCSGWDLMDILTMGFGGVPDKLVTKPPRHLSSVTGQVVNFFYTLCSEVAGAESFANFDTLLAPFVAYDDLTRTQLKQIMQEFVFNMNVSTKVGGQTAFTNLTFDITVPQHLADMDVNIGGEPYYVFDGNGIRQARYGDFQAEMDLLNEVWWEVMLEGDGEGKPFTFPIPTVNITDTFNWDSKVMELIMEATRKYGIPYFASYIDTGISPEDNRSMCCRLKIDLRELKKRVGGLFASNGKTGSIGVVTINFPQLGYLSRTEADFYRKLGDVMDTCKEALEVKRRVIEEHMEQGLYPFSRVYLAPTKQCTGKYYANHFSSIGVLGMNECCLNFLGRDIADPEALEFVRRVLDFMRARIQQYQEQTGNLYNIEETPAESTCYRLAKQDKELYPDIICANEADYRDGVEPYYTNSSHLPVDYTNKLLVALVHQGMLKEKYTGGSVLHVFADEEMADAIEVKALVRMIATDHNIPYFTFSPAYSTCRKCGPVKGKTEICPTCGGECIVWSRIVGYNRPVNMWNIGKRTEYKDRLGFEV